MIILSFPISQGDKQLPKTGHGEGHLLPYLQENVHTNSRFVNKPLTMNVIIVLAKGVSCVSDLVIDFSRASKCHL